jgi:hypothetical protein
MKRGPKPIPPELRFWSRIGDPDLNGCRHWLGRIHPCGYGVFSPKARQYVYTHVYSWRFFNGWKRPKNQILHNCDVRSCIEPSHLYEGTLKDNTRDMIARGRARWDGAGIRKLSRSQKFEIGVRLRRGESMRSIAIAFEVSVATVKHYRDRPMKYWSLLRVD